MVPDSDCSVSEDALERCAMGMLPEAELAPVIEHLFICDACWDRLSEVEAFVHATRQAARNLMAAPPSRWQEWWTGLFRVPAPVWVGALTVVAVILFWVAQPRSPADIPPVTVLLQSARGLEGLAIDAAPTGKPLRLAWDARELPGLASYRVEVVDSAGRLRHQQSAAPAEGRFSIQVAALAHGQYWIRVYDPAPPGELLREFGLRVE